MYNIGHCGYLLEKLTRPEKNVNRENNCKSIYYHIAEIYPSEECPKQYQNQQKLHKIGAFLPSCSCGVGRLYMLTVGF
jgi:hypothetical protein